MKDVLGSLQLTNYRQYIDYHIVRDTLEEVKVLIHYVDAEDQDTDVRKRPLEWKSLANNVEILTRVWYRG